MQVLTLSMVANPYTLRRNWQRSVNYELDRMAVESDNHFICRNWIGRMCFYKRKRWFCLGKYKCNIFREEERGEKRVSIVIKRKG